jgi:NAD(P)-dependent dehydrogenase (short-subunit alcohol dehydrogenase family)
VLDFEIHGLPPVFQILSYHGAMNPYQGAVALVTGGASGIGRALCEELARRGAAVVVTDLDEQGAAAVASAIGAAGGRASSARLDVCRAEEVERVYQEAASAHGRLDYVFNNAGIAVVGEVRDLDLEHWRRLVDVNLGGVIHGVHTAYRLMVKQGSGHIVNTASLAGLVGFPTALPYATTKAAVVGLSLSLRAEGADLGVKVSVACPGFVQSAIFDAGDYVGSDKKEALSLIPVRFVPAPQAARVILDGVARNRAVIVFPFYARFMGWLQRFAPGLLERLHRKTVRDFRKRRKMP